MGETYQNTKIFCNIWIQKRHIYILESISHSFSSCYSLWQVHNILKLKIQSWIPISFLSEAGKILLLKVKKTWAINKTRQSCLMVITKGFTSLTGLVQYLSPTSFYSYRDSVRKNVTSRNFHNIFVSSIRGHSKSTYARRRGGG